MPNYNVVVKDNFRPFTFQEMATPYTMYKEEFDKQQAALSELNEKASVFENIANEQQDPLAYAKYKAFSDNLKQQSSALATQGLSSGIKSSLMALKGDYSKRIVPIETAYNRRMALSEEQRQKMAQDPTMMYERMAGNMSLDDFIRDPTANYGQSYSGAMLTKQVSDAATHLSKAAKESEEGKELLRRKLAPFQYEIARRAGFSPEAVMKAITGDPNADSILTGIVDNVLKGSNIGMLDASGNNIGAGWGDNATRKKALEFARQGLYPAIGNVTYKDVHDTYSEAKAKEADKAKKQQEVELGTMAINPMYIYNQQELGNRKKELDAFKKYFEVRPDGSFVGLTKEGEEKLKNVDNPITMTNSTGASVLNYTPGDSERFRQFVKERLGGDPSNIGKYTKEVEDGSFDAYRRTVYNSYLDSETSKAAKDILDVASMGSPLMEAKFDFENNKYIASGDEIDSEDFASGNYSVLSTRVSPYGHTVVIKDSDSGEVKEYLLPKTVNKRTIDNMDISFARAQEWDNKMQEIKQKILAGEKGHEGEYARAEREYKLAIMNANKYAADLWGTNKTKKQEFEQQGY